MKLTEAKLKQLIIETINETIFVDDKGRAVDLTSDSGSPEDRRYFEKNKIFDHPNQEIREKANILRSRSQGFGFDEEGYVVPISAEEKEEAQKELDFLIDMSHHPNEKIRKMFNSELIGDVKQAISIGEVDNFAPPKYTPPPMTDDEQYEQGIYDDFDTPGGYGKHNFPDRYASAEANRDYTHEYNVIKRRMKAEVEKARGDDPDPDYNDMFAAARRTPGWRQLADKLGDSDNMFGQDFASMPYDVLREYGLRDPFGDDPYPSRSSF